MQAPRDAYGFLLEDLSAAQAAQRQACDAYEARRRAKWEPWVARQELPLGRVLKRYCRKGVPHELRGWVWWHVSGAGAAAAAAPPDHYQRCLEAGSSKSAVKQIELDLPRTFPGHPWLAGPEGQVALRDVLTAFAGHNPDVGYCQARARRLLAGGRAAPRVWQRQSHSALGRPQRPGGRTTRLSARRARLHCHRPQGMNFIVGLLLCCVDHDCVRSFWLLVVLLEQVLYPGTFAPQLDGAHVEMGVLGQLLAAKQPRLATHLAAIGVEPSLLATHWFLCLFATSLPPESCARVWDALLCEGAKLLHRLALALLAGAARQLMALDNAGEVLRCLKAHAAACHDRDALMAAAFTRIGGLPRARLAKLQAAEATRVAAQLASREASRRRADLKQSIAAGKTLQAASSHGSGLAALGWDEGAGGAGPGPP